MKNLISLFVFLFVTNIVMAQNMVPNGNFESYLNCPTSYGRIEECVGWSQYISSTDYFNPCVTGIGRPSVPINGFGNQAAASGNAYGGFVVFINNSTREALGKTINPLVVGNLYEVSMSVSLADDAIYGLNSLGVHFIQNAPTTSTSVIASTITPKVSYSSYGPISNKTGWTRLSSVFTADSAYNFIAITCWGPYTSYIIDTSSTGGSSYAYYYIDSVVIKQLNGITNLYADSMICAGDTFQVPYTVNSASVFNTGNVFSVQLSNASGSFASGVTTVGSRTATTAGSIACVIPTSITPGNNYRIRIRSTNLMDSSGVNQRDISIGVTRPNVSNSSNSPICTGQQLNLSATSTTTGVSYKWSGPVSFSSTVQNPTISNATTTNIGDYIVFARLYGCLAKDTTTVVVTNASSSNVIATGSTTICEGDSLLLNATVGMVANSYSWSGPGGFNANSKDTLRANSVPAMSGDYLFTAYYTGCTIRDTVTIDVKPQATNRSIGSNSPVCTDNTLTLNAGSSSTGVAYTWTGPNSFVATSSSASISGVTMSNAGKYIVSYLLNGCITKDSLTVTVDQSPLPVTAGANTPLCEGTTLSLSSTTSTNGATYSWAGPGSYSATSQNTTRTNSTLAMSDDYVITATLSNGCVKKDTVTVLVKPRPDTPDASSNSPVCTGATINLTGTNNTSGVSYIWNGPAGFSSTAQSPVRTGAITAYSGIYRVYTSLNGCASLYYDSTSVTVYPVTASPVPSANTPLCLGQDLQLVAGNIPGASYVWSGPGGYSSTLQNPLRPASTSMFAGRYYVQAIVNGCISSPDSIAVVVNAAPNITMYPSPKDSICVGQSVTFVSSTSNAGSSYTRNWFRNNTVIGGAANANYSTTTAADGDEYYTTIIVYGVCATPYTDTSNIIKMRVLPYLVPTVSIAANPNATVKSGTMINFTATPTNGGSRPAYQWLVNGSYIIGAISNVWGASTLSNNDVICAEMTSNYLCPNPKKAKSDCIKVSIESTGIVGVWRGKEPSIYPNPATEKLIIEGVEKGTKVQLNDVLGRVLIKATATSETTELNMNHLAAGNYILLLSTDNGDRMTVKVVKE